MDFAKNLLKKYGWEEGKGLGKKSDGIVKPLKANLKFDNSGLGLDKSTEFNNHWWKRVFDKAASNIDVQKTGEDVVFELKNGESTEISTKDYSVRELEKLKNDQKHKNFIKSSVLLGPGKQEEIPEKINVDKLKFKESQVLTDEELFIACGGRTAHKGARHGLNMKGKLDRIEEQEREMMSKMSESFKTGKESWIKVDNKNKRKFKTEYDECNEPEELACILHTAEYSSKSKKKMKKDKKIENNLINSLISTKISSDKEEVIEEQKVAETNKKKRHRKKKGNGVKKETVNNLDFRAPHSPKTMEEEHMENHVEENDHSSNLLSIELVNEKRKEKLPKRNKNKNKNKNVNSNNQGINQNSKNISKCEKKKLKKSLKKLNATLRKTALI